MAIKKLLSLIPAFCGIADRQIIYRSSLYGYRIKRLLQQKGTPEYTNGHTDIHVNHVKNEVLTWSGSSNSAEESEPFCI